MQNYLKSLFKGIPLGCLLVGGGLAAVTGTLGWLALGVLGAAALSAPRHLSRRNRMLDRVAAVTGVVNRQKLEDLRQLSAKVSGVQGVPGAEQYGLQLRDQFDGANAKYLNFRELLGSKFDAGEMTFGRYVKSAEQVYLSLLDGVQSGATIVSSLRAIDLDQIRAQVRTLKRVEAPSDAQVKELATLEHRMELRESELESLRELLSTNEQSLTTLTVAGTALTKLQTEEGRTALDSDTAMRELEDLASRAERYSLKSTGGSN